MHIPLPDLYNMVCTGFRDARWDIRDPPQAQSPPGSADQHDEEHMDGRLDQEENQEAINKANQKSPDISSILARIGLTSSAGISGTMLTGSGGVNPTGLQLGKNSLLGA